MAPRKANERTTFIEGLRRRQRSIFVEEPGSWRLEAMATLLHARDEGERVEPAPILNVGGKSR